MSDILIKKKRKPDIVGINSKVKFINFSFPNEMFYSKFIYSK